MSTKPEPTPQPLLRVENLHVSYSIPGGEQHAVRGVSFEVNAGEVVAIVGESGSGKSTTAHAIINLLAGNARRSAGVVSLAGTDLSQLSQGEWRQVRGKRIGLIPQDPSASLDPLQKVGDQVAEVLRIHQILPRKQASARAVDLLKDAGIKDADSRARQFPHQFSGGMRQRALIAAALAGDPELVIADEPTSALDVTVQRQILDNIAALTASRGTAVLLITHDLGVAAERADRVIVMKNGQVVEQGAAAQVLSNPTHSYTRALIAAAPGLNPRRLVPSQGPDSGQRQARTTPEPSPLVVVEGLNKVFALPRGGARGARSVTAVDGVSFAVNRGETLALVGESGSGKSTIARLLLRLEKADSGTVSFDGQDVLGAKGAGLRALRRRFQVVFQSPFASLDPRFSVGESIAEPLRAFESHDRAQREARVHDLLDAVQLPRDYARRRPDELSGGQRQRVAIARALAVKPELVILDEAVSALDVSVQAQILQLLVDLQAEDGLSYLFITHDLGVVQQVADRVAVLRQGALVELGSTAQVLGNPVEDYTKALVAAIPGRELAVAPAG